MRGRGRSVDPDSHALPRLGDLHQQTGARTVYRHKDGVRRGSGVEYSASYIQGGSGSVRMHPTTVHQSDSRALNTNGSAHTLDRVWFWGLWTSSGRERGPSLADEDRHRRLPLRSQC